MAVKDFVHLYESSSPPTPKSRIGTGSMPTIGEQSSGSLHADDKSLDGNLAPRPARFIKRPESTLVGHSRASRPPSVHSTPSTTSATLSTTSRPQDTLPKAGVPQKPSKSLRSHHPRFSHAHFTRQSGLGKLDTSEDQESLVKHMYPPQSPWSDSGNGVTLQSPNSYSQYPRHHSHHKPIPAPVVFSRNAYPLSLPKLDEHLASLTPPVILIKDGGTGDMFPPLDRLEKIGLSVDDLETNVTVPPAWRNRTSILGTALNAIIGFLVRVTMLLRKLELCLTPVTRVPVLLRRSTAYKAS